MKLGANIDAHQKEGKGVVKVGLETAQTIKHSLWKQKALHVRIMICVNLTKASGAVDEPALKELNALNATIDPSELDDTSPRRIILEEICPGRLEIDDTGKIELNVIDTYPSRPELDDTGKIELNGIGKIDPPTVDAYESEFGDIQELPGIF